jgi:hypothetical protein
MKNLFPILLLCAFCSSAKASDSVSCLPNDVKNDTVISGGNSPREIVTVQEALRRIGARCQNGKLVDKAGREIRFFHLIGCWGNPPVDYQEQLSHQAREIERLKPRYTVLEIPCATTNLRTIQ